MPMSTEENTSAGTNDPVAPTSAPVTIGPTTPPRFDTVFCMPATIDTAFSGATSPGNAQTCDAATVVPDFAMHSSSTAIAAECANAASPMLDAITSPVTRKSLRVAVSESLPLAYTRSDAQPARISTTIEASSGKEATQPISSTLMPRSFIRYVGSHVMKKYEL